MKKLIFILPILLICFTFSSCENSSDNYSANYYVRYVLQPTYGHITEYSITLDDGSLEEHSTGNTGGSYSYTIGPVSKGFTAQIITHSNRYYCTSTIEVCLGSEPFVQKASGEGSISYTIDF